jgi:hypothetical protein
MKIEHFDPNHTQAVDPSPVRQISVDKIKIRKNWNIRRDIDPGKVEEISKSMSIIGLLKPILVNTELEIIAGERRFYAARKLGWKHIITRIVDFKNPNHERLAHLDENLEHKTLAPGDHAHAINERKVIWETLFPETRKGAAGGHAKARTQSDQPTNDKSSSAEDDDKLKSKEKQSFANKEAKAAGVNKRTIERKAKVGAKCSPATIKALNASSITNSTAETLANETHEIQDEVLKLLRSDWKGIKHTKDLISNLVSKAKGSISEELLNDPAWGPLYPDTWLKEFVDLIGKFQVRLPYLIDSGLLDKVQDEKMKLTVKSLACEVYFCITKNAKIFGLEKAVKQNELPNE